MRSIDRLPHLPDPPLDLYPSRVGEHAIAPGVSVSDYLLAGRVTVATDFRGGRVRGQ